MDQHLQGTREMTQDLINIIIPTYNQLDVFLNCLRSIERTTPNYFISWYDDGSETLTPEIVQEAYRITHGRTHFEQWSHRGNITLAWNSGIDPNAEYTAIVNSDIIFSNNWYEPLMHAAQTYALVGPMTNAPGSYEQQRIPNVHAINDEPETINTIAAWCASQPTETIPGRIGGFFLFGRTDAFIKHAYDNTRIFNPSYPLLGNEDEYQTRVLAQGGTIGTCPNCYIFHYRSLSRQLKTVNPHLLAGMYRNDPTTPAKNKTLLYTSIINDYDHPRLRQVNYPNVDTMIYSKESGNVKEQRQIKILAATNHPEYEYSLWVDGSIIPVCDPTPLIEQYLDKHDICFFRHPTRTCTYQEAHTVIQLKLDDPDIVNHQIETYKTLGFPIIYGLPETGVILRRHTDKIREFERTWWTAVEQGSHRDQLSVSFSLWFHDITPNWFPLTIGTTDLVDHIDHKHFRIPLTWGQAS
jgi:GT2 family glycosyltransferase